MEGPAVTDVLLDTGWSQTLVKSDLVPTTKRVEGDAVTIRCAHGDTVLYPLANVGLVVDGIPLAEDSGQMPPHALEISAEELQRLQKEDDTLVAVNTAADGDPSTAGVGFFRRDGLLYRRWQPPGQNSEALVVEQLVLPQACQPTSGHLGRDKTARRVLQWFYWPTLFRDMANYCKHCTDCQ